MQYDPTYQNQYIAHPMNREQDGYAMNGYAPPPPGMSCPFPSPSSSLGAFTVSSPCTSDCLPLTIVPVYDRNHEDTPAYLPPEGASKVNPDQGDYAAVPPPGAPPVRDDHAPAYPAPVAGSSARHQV